jgi:hypothetical protein
MSFHIKNSAGTKLQQHTGVWMYDSDTQSLPISKSGNVLNGTSNTVLSDSGGTVIYNDTDDLWVIPIGYKIILYENADNTGKNLTIDNTEGTTTRVVKNTETSSWSANYTSSVKVYYKNVEIN